MAALPLPEVELVPIEPTQEQLDELVADYHASHLDLDTDTSVSSESEISTTDSQPHYTQIKPNWSKGIQAMQNRNNKTKRRKLAQQKLCKEKPPNKRGTKGFVSCPWKELDVRENIQSFVTLLCVDTLLSLCLTFCLFVLEFEKNIY